jgi:hypothetical protein
MYVNTEREGRERKRERKGGREGGERDALYKGLGELNISLYGNNSCM